MRGQLDHLPTACGQLNYLLIARSQLDRLLTACSLDRIANRTRVYRALFGRRATHTLVTPAIYAPTPSQYLRFQWLSLLPTWLFEGAWYINFVYFRNKLII